MRYSVNWGEVKTVTINGVATKLFEGEFKGLDGSIIEASIWEKDKDNKIFPGFSDLRPGAEFEGTSWTNPKNNKISIYPPKEWQSTARPSKIEKLMDKKSENIEIAQERKEQSIAYFNSLNTAIQFIVGFKDRYDALSTDKIVEEVFELSQTFRDKWKNYKSQPF